MFSDQLPNWAEGLTALISAATLFAVFLAGIQIRHLNKQMHREFEMQYLTRFWQLTDKFSTDMKMEGIVTREDAALMGSSPFGVRSECEAVGMGRYNM